MKKVRPLVKRVLIDFKNPNVPHGYVLGTGTIKKGDLIWVRGSESWEFMDNPMNLDAASHKIYRKVLDIQG